MLRLAAFLGNPGAEYRNNRHNAGRLLAGRLSFALDWRKKFKGLYAAVEQSRLGSFAAPPPDGGAEKFHFIMPETYMNLSGDSVAAAAAFFHLKPEEIIVVHDELELPPGTLSLKFSGGLGGHNGLRSVMARLGTAGFWRLRLGIGRPAGRSPGEGGPPGSGGDVSGWVLSDFAAHEGPLLEAALECGAKLLVRALLEGPDGLLPEWGKKRTAEQ